MDTREKAVRFPMDAILRKWGWRIVSRPKDGEPIWENEGVVKTERDAIETVKQWQQKRAAV